MCSISYFSLWYLSCYNIGKSICCRNVLFIFMITLLLSFLPPSFAFALHCSLQWGSIFLRHHRNHINSITNIITIWSRQTSSRSSNIIIITIFIIIIVNCQKRHHYTIQVTSLTDFLSFFAGVITPFPCVRIFCIYTGTAVAFIYVWQLTFFGACLVIIIIIIVIIYRVSIIFIVIVVVAIIITFKFMYANLSLLWILSYLAMDYLLNWRRILIFNVSLSSLSASSMS